MFLLLLNNLVEASRPPLLILFSLEMLVTIPTDYIDLSGCPDYGAAARAEIFAVIFPVFINVFHLSFFVLAACLVSDSLYILGVNASLF